jgi:hypothetical protein
LSPFGGARESDHQIGSNTSVSESSTSLLPPSERKRDLAYLSSSVICPTHAQITIKTLFLIGNSERATPAQPFQPRERRGLAFEPESFDSAFCIPLCRRRVGSALRAHLEFVGSPWLPQRTNEGVNRREKGKWIDMWQPCRLQNANNDELGEKREMIGMDGNEEAGLWLRARNEHCIRTRDTNKTYEWCVSINTSASVSAAACHRILLTTRSIRRPFCKSSNPQLIIGVSVQAIPRPRAPAPCHLKRHRIFWIRWGGIRIIRVVADDWARVAEVAE